MTLKVLSCSPRVFEIRNFLSDFEVEHIMNIATGAHFKRSVTGSSRGRVATDGAPSSRTSFNSWIPRGRSPILDAIYRRAADLLRIDEALLRHRRQDEHPNLATKHSIAENLQLVHYEGGQQYTDHHDFSLSNIGHGNDQNARFATILFYLNDDMSGGETSFPRWVSWDSSEDLKVKPERGKAVLFYSQLPGKFETFMGQLATYTRF